MHYPIIYFRLQPNLIRMWGKIIVLVCLAAIAPRVYKYIRFQDYHVHVYNQRPGPCRILSNIVNGSEDMHLLPNGKVLITSGLRFHVNHPKFVGVEGRVYQFDLKEPDKEAAQLDIRGDLNLQDFNPVGLSAWTEDNGDVFVFIINFIHHRGTVVERFKYDEQNLRLHHVETIQDPNFVFLNNLVMTGSRQFYFTNFLNNWLQWEQTLMLYRSTAGYYDGTSSKIVADGMLIANGIAMSPDGRYVYISHIFDKEVRIYRRNQDNSLEFMQGVPLYSAPDNLYVDPSTGDLWVAGPPVVHSTFEYMEDPRNVPAPSRVLRLTMEDGHVTSVVQVLADDGSFISSSTVALFDNNKLLVGNIHTSPVFCEVKYIM